MAFQYITHIYYHIYTPFSIQFSYYNQSPPILLLRSSTQLDSSLVKNYDYTDIESFSGIVDFGGLLIEKSVKIVIATLAIEVVGNISRGETITILTNEQLESIGCNCSQNTHNREALLFTSSNKPYFFFINNVDGLALYSCDDITEQCTIRCQIMWTT